MMQRVIWTLLISIFMCAPLSISPDLKPAPTIFTKSKKRILFRIPQTVLPTFKPHLEKFLKVAKKYKKKLNVKTLIIMFGPTEQVKQNKGFVTIGYCQHLEGIQLIVIDKKNWTLSSYAKKEMLIVHELGHCLLDRDHRDTLKDNGEPKSIMKSVIFSDYVYMDNEEYYWKELFTFDGKEDEVVCNFEPDEVFHRLR